MEILLILCLFGLLMAGWIHFSNRLDTVESQLEALRKRIPAHVPAQLIAQPKPAPATPSEPPAEPTPEPVPAAVPEPPRPAPVFPPPEPALRPAPPAIILSPEPPAPRRSPLSSDWEATLGGNWFNKAGVLVLVIGIALLLGYAFTRVGPAGRVAVSLATSFAMLAAGAVFESREPYRNFARGLLGGGWAALYFTVYAMHAVDAARVIESAAAGAILLFSVAVGMIVHSLRYRSQTVAGMAYFIAFATLAITQVTSLSILAMIPLAASLLFVSHRFGWSGMALLGLAATYSVCVLRGDTGAPLWQAQTIFAIFWLLFEGFDILHADSGRRLETLLPLNAAGFLGLSIMKWHAAAPDRVWMLLTASSFAYLASAVLRSRSGKWHGAATLTAALAAAAIFQKLDHQWVASALVIEAELLYLAGVRLRAPYLRWLATSLFAVETGRLFLFDVSSLPVDVWTPVAALDSAIFYGNRAFYAADVFYGYAAAGMIAVIAGYETTEPARGQTWFLLAAGPFLVGWWRRLRDFRIQGYALALLGAIGILFAIPQPAIALVIGAALSYAVALCAVWSAPDRFTGEERDAVRLFGSFAASIGTAALIWRLVPGQYLGLGWMALALLLLELGLRGLPRDLRWPAYAVAATGALRLVYFNLLPLHNLLPIQNGGPLIPRLIPGAAAMLAYAMSARARTEEHSKVFMAASGAGTAFLLTAFWALLPDAASPAWAVTALALFYIGLEFDLADFRRQSYAVAALAFLRCLTINIVGSRDSILTGAIVIALLYAAQFVAARGSHARLYYSSLATALTTLLLYYESSGSLLTVAWGIEGVALLASGFPLRDRLLRLSGLALLLTCILKLFAWDLRHLETLPRILSFIVLGLILVGVSWVYTRFRDRVESVLRG